MTPKKSNYEQGLLFKYGQNIENVDEPTFLEVWPDFSGQNVTLGFSFSDLNVTLYGL